MNKYTVQIASSAAEDIEQILFYIEQVLLEPKIAMNMVDDIEKAIFSLELYPKRGTLINSGKLKGLGYRHILIKNYVIVYRIVEETSEVIILAVKYAKSNY